MWVDLSQPAFAVFSLPGHATCVGFYLRFFFSSGKQWEINVNSDKSAQAVPPFMSDLTLVSLFGG